MAQEVNIDSKVKVKINGEVREFQVVGSADVDAALGRISYLSPLGETLLGKRVGDNFEFMSPSGKILFGQVLEIN